MVDKPKCDQMLNNLRNYLAELKKLSAVSSDLFLNDKDKIGNTKYHFVIAIECCIDIANHIISSENFRFPRNNADSFAVLVENGIISSELSGTYQAMAKFRNRLVHLYWDIDDQQVYDYLQNYLEDFSAYIDSIAAFITQ